ncbi:MAG: NAD-binding protein [Thermostichales cyanobacterium BF4_bins_65]
MKTALALRRYGEWLLYHPWTEFFLMGAISLLGILIMLDAAWPGTGIPIAIDGLLWLFRLEVVGRFWVARRKQRFWLTYWPDVLALLPLNRMLALLRLWRLGELLKRRLSQRRDFNVGQALDVPISVTLVLLLIVGMGTLIIHQVEEKSLLEAFWYTTYSFISNEPQGEVSTESGRLATLLLMISGLLLFALVTGIVSAVMIERFQTAIEIRRLSVDELRGHIVICGWNRNGHVIIQELQSEAKLQHLPIVIVAEFSQPIEQELSGVDRTRLYFHTGDYTRLDVLEAIGIRYASQAILLADSTRPRSDQDRDARTVLAALTIERLNGEIHTCAQLLDRRNDVQLRAAGVEDVVVGDEMTSYLIATSARNQGLSDVLAELMTVQVGNQFYKISLPANWVNASFLEASQRLKKDHDAILIAVERLQGSTRQSLVNPPATLPLLAGDELIVIATRPPRPS